MQSRGQEREYEKRRTKYTDCCSGMQQSGVGRCDQVVLGTDEPLGQPTSPPFLDTEGQHPIGAYFTERVSCSEQE